MGPYMHAPLPTSQELRPSKLSGGSKRREISMLGRTGSGKRGDSERGVHPMARRREAE
jgi:hypothetical protein